MTFDKAQQLHPDGQAGAPNGGGKARMLIDTLTKTPFKNF